MKVIRETCVAGLTIDRSIRVSSGDHTVIRGKRKNVTKETVQKNNDRLAAKDLGRKLNANFHPGDFHLTLSYREAPTREQAKKDREKFIRQLRNEMKKLGQELKYVAVTEYENKRIHHHIVINKTDVDLIAKCWTHGWFEPKSLDSTGNYFKLADYLIKETTKTFRKPDALFKRRYSCSGNLIRPVVKREEVNVSDLFEDPEPVKGYYIPKDSIHEYEHPVTGMLHREWVMVALDKPIRQKVWPRGTRVNTREYFKVEYEEEQVSFDANLAWEDL